MYIKNKMRYVHSLIFLIIVFGISHVNAENDKSLNFSDALIVLPAAQNVRHVKFEGTDQLSYKLIVDYPADKIIRAISENLESKGWDAMEEDYLNPGLPSSHVKGWTSFIDATKQPERCVHQWLAQWENKRHDIAWYAFRYEYPKDKSPDMKTLYVYSVFIPAPLVKAAKEHLLQK